MSQRINIIIEFSSIIERDGDSFDATIRSPEIKAALLDSYREQITQYLHRRDVDLCVEIRVPNDELGKYFLNKIKAERMFYTSYRDDLYVAVMRGTVFKPVYRY